MYRQHIPSKKKYYACYLRDGDWIIYHNHIDYNINVLKGASHCIFEGHEFDPSWLKQAEKCIQSFEDEMKAYQ